MMTTNEAERGHTAWRHELTELLRGLHCDTRTACSTTGRLFDVSVQPVETADGSVSLLVTMFPLRALEVDWSDVLLVARADEEAGGRVANLAWPGRPGQVIVRGLRHGRYRLSAPRVWARTAAATADQFVDARTGDGTLTGALLLGPGRRDVVLRANGERRANAPVAWGVVDTSDGSLRDTGGGPLSDAGRREWESPPAMAAASVRREHLVFWIDDDE